MGKKKKKKIRKGGEQMNTVIPIKPIRPTQIFFNSNKEKAQFEKYISSSEKTESIGMEKMREKMKEFKEKRT
ncbi:hypothetical protein GCM10023310_72240 [Paenibacillus vulneris]|uniref:Uncharacterized protein n=1 Tax=Paenibacillus vulneris TaxID=1133364 RepID=A0ABW3UFH1_9BACL